MGFVDKMIKRSRLKSPWIVHFDCGSCNGCDIEVLACLTPLYDVERFGVVNTGNPKHADVLLVTGTEYDGAYTWYQVNYSGMDGYVRSDMCQMLTIAELQKYLAEAARATPAPNGATVTPNKNNLRQHQRHAASGSAADRQQVVERHGHGHAELRDDRAAHHA